MNPMNPMNPMPRNAFTRSTVFTPAQALAPLRVSPRELEPHNQAFIQFVRQYPAGITVAQVFADYKDAGMTMEALLKRVTYLVGKRWLRKTGKGAAAVLTFNAERPKKPSVAAAKKTPAKAASKAAFIGTVAPARQVSVLHGPLYVPPAAPPARAGSLDFKALASHGWRC